MSQARTALALLAIDPVGLGGIVIRSRVSPARDAILQASVDLMGPALKLHPAMTPEILDGGLDLSATLETGRVTRNQGLLVNHSGPVLLSMAERTGQFLAARLAQALDEGEISGLIALDEGIDDEQAPASICDRLAFQVGLDDIGLVDLQHMRIDSIAVSGQPASFPGDLPEQLITIASQLGINSLRAPIFALRTSQAHAALFGRDRVLSDDVVAAVTLVYAHRATQLPEQDETPAEQRETDQSRPEEKTQELDRIPDEMILEAVCAALPDGLLGEFRSGKATAGKGAGTGQKIIGNRRGRPLPARDRKARGRDSIDVMATLRAAVPWQRVRKMGSSDHRGPIIRPSDLREKRYQNLSDRVLVFAVDASGSAAVARLNEAKGAIELLLAEAYSRRDHVALISFRGSAAEVLLPPTRSLVQTKRRLASMPGGGGTPLAAGLKTAFDMAMSSRRKGLSASLIVLTDGRSNMALDGTANREQARLDVLHVGTVVAKSGLDVILIDTGTRPDRGLRSLSDRMLATYVALPRADARQLSAVINRSIPA